MSKAKVNVFGIVFGGLFGLWVAAMFILLFNPFGLAQRLVWGMQPPYHWVSTHNVIDERYLTGANGKVCASLYYYEGEWTVYGNGFNDDNTSKEALEHVAERNCR